MDHYQQSIIVKTQLEALHQWGNIPSEHPSQYLKNLHRHNFHIELRFIVNHSDRDIEFIAFKQKIDKFLQNYFICCKHSNLINMNNFSCEMLGNLLLHQFKADGCYWVQVLEDGEMGSIVEILE
jgi:6-pyruvoyl-tetrahydropterin synthase